MAPLHFFVKFLGSTFQFRIVNPEKYTLHALCCNVYMLQCSTFPEPTEKFKVEINLPWTGRYVVVEDDIHLQQILDMLTARKFDKVVVEIDLLPLAMEPSFQPDDASSFGSISEEADYSDSNEEEAVDHSDEEEAEDELSSNSDIGGKDEVLEDTELDEDQMSDAASFEFDNELMADGAADEESDSKHKPSKQMRGVPFRVGRNEQIKLEVGQLFQNLQHFRHLSTLVV
ncbi:hypothetical protein ACOSQ4_006146 [Xanthoceras sorbifolium]